MPATHTLTLIVKPRASALDAADTPEKLDMMRRAVLSECKTFLAGHGICESDGVTDRHMRPGTFTPAHSVERQPLYHPYGVVLGKTDPALFMFCISNAQFAMAEQVSRQLMGIMDQIKPIIKGEVEGASFMALTIDGSKLDARTLDWCVKQERGEFHADIPLYSLPHGTANLSPEQQSEIQRGMKEYAICVLNVQLPEVAI